MNRYLLNLSYVGTGFYGVQRNIIKKLDGSTFDMRTIQGSIELALKVFRPANEVNTVLSSRTDSGVHALHTTMHVDLLRDNSQPYDTTTITGVLNRTFLKSRLPIRIQSTRIVPDDFHCRYHALGRTYLYRLAVAKDKIVIISESNNKNKSYERFVPAEELDRCYFLQDAEFDIDKFRAASRMFIGRHDFRTFMSTNRERTWKTSFNPSRDHPRFTLRSIKSIDIKPGKTVAVGPNAALAEELYNYWDIEISGKSFVYKQVRRMVGSLIAFAIGRIDERCIYEMLTIPSKNTWNPRINLAPAYGLYLARVHYNENAFEIPQQESIDSDTTEN